MKAVAIWLKLKLKEQFVIQVSASGNHDTCLLLEIKIIFRDSNIQIFLNGDVLLNVNCADLDGICENGAVEGQLLLKERGGSGACRLGLKKAVRAEDSGHVNKVCVKTFVNFHS